MERYDVIQGAEAFYHKGNEVGILVSHGFMGTPQSMEHIGTKAWQLKAIRFMEFV
ncbi:hypothetical protein OC195_13240 [Priestia flexa]|nr:hypothetical protein OC195_13240 [Priestia flexa]